jgi:hypothetical protein
MQSKRLFFREKGVKKKKLFNKTEKYDFLVGREKKLNLF